jgi:hypothetical protein
MSDLNKIAVTSAGSSGYRRDFASIGDHRPLDPASGRRSRDAVKIDAMAWHLRHGCSHDREVFRAISL